MNSHDHIKAPEAIVSSFPKRALQVKPIKSDSVFGAVIATLVWLIAVVAVISLATPVFIRDYKIGASMEYVDADIDGECSSRLFVFTGCNVKITYDGEKIGRNLFFIDSFEDSYEVGAVVASDDPSLVTIDLAIDKFWNRAVLILALTGLLSWLVFVGIVGIFKRKKLIAYFARMSGSSLTPVLVPVKVSMNKKTLIAQYFVDIDGKNVIGVVSGKKGKGAIFIPVEEADSIYALGVISADCQSPVLLDIDFKRLDLTDAERGLLTGALKSIE